MFRNKQFSLGEITMINFVVIGFCASTVLFLSWPFAPILGWEYRKHCGVGRLVLPAALGIFLGGLPLWLFFTGDWSMSWTTRCLMMAGTSLLFLTGAIAIHLAELFLQVRALVLAKWHKPAA